MPVLLFAKNPFSPFPALSIAVNPPYALSFDAVRLLRSCRGEDSSEYVEGETRGGEKEDAQENRVSHLRNGPGRGPLELVKALLHRRHHRRRAAEEHLGVLGMGAELLTNHVDVDESDASVPVGRGVVEDVEDLEAVRVRSGEFVELLLEEDVLRVDVGVDERELGRVLGVLQRSTDDLLRKEETQRGSVGRKGPGEGRGRNERASG